MLSSCWGNLQTGGATLVDAIFEDFQEQSGLKITHEQRRFIEVDKSEPIKICELEKTSEAIKAFPAQ